MAVPEPVGEPEGDQEWMVGVEGVGVNVPDDLRAVLLAAEDGDANDLSAALGNLSVSVDSPGEDQDTALHLASLYGHEACVQLLLAAGASLDVRDEDGSLPLHDAAAGGFVDIVQMLVGATKSQEQLKSVLRATDSDGDTPLHHAARGSHADVLRLLLNHGGLPNLKNNADETPADLADHDEVKQLLLLAEDKISPGSVDDKLVNLKRRKTT